MTAWTTFDGKYNPKDLRLNREGAGHSNLDVMDDYTMKLLNMLTDAFRERFNKGENFEFPITSSYRTPEFDLEVSPKESGEPGYHAHGKALDIITSDMSSAEKQFLIEKAAELGFNGFGHYHRQGFVHIDTRAHAEEWSSGGAMPAWFAQAVDRGRAARNPNNPVPEGSQGSSLAARITGKPGSRGQGASNPLLNMIMGGDGAAEYEADMAMKLGMLMVVFQFLAGVFSGEESPFQALFNGQAMRSSDPPTLVAAAPAPRAQPAPA